MRNDMLNFINLISDSGNILSTIPRTTRHDVQEQFSRGGLYRLSGDTHHLPGYRVVLRLQKPTGHNGYVIEDYFAF